MELSKMIQKLVLLPILLLSVQASFAVCGEDPEEGVPYLYPFFYDDADEYTGEPASKADKPEEKSPTAWYGNMGRAKVIVDVENTDFLSQCQAEWDNIQKKNKPEKQKTPGSRDEDEEEKKNYSPRVSASIKWSTED
jgi:hypothetical protein